jgi:S-adenosyl-L-methionine hydrolase (adenosine-forming)
LLILTTGSGQETWSARLWVNNMSTIALLTDFGITDPYVGIMKGVIASINPRAGMIDVTHSVNPQDIVQGAFFLLKSYRYFPPGTVFTVVVDPGVGTRRKAIAVQAGDYYFVAPDNGVLYPVIKKIGIEKIVELTNSEFMLHPLSNTFHGRDIFAPASAYISKGVSLEPFGVEVKDVVKLSIPGIKKEKGYIEGTVLFADRFGNIITSIEEKDVAKMNISKIIVNDMEISGIRKSYGEVKKGEMLAVIGSYGNLEISVNSGSAEEKTGTDWDKKVKVYFV